jgi:hypothetical protein
MKIQLTIPETYKRAQRIRVIRNVESVKNYFILLNLKRKNGINNDNKK